MHALTLLPAISLLQQKKVPDTAVNAISKKCSPIGDTFDSRQIDHLIYALLFSVQPIGSHTSEKFDVNEKMTTLTVGNREPFTFRSCMLTEKVQKSIKWVQ